MNATSKAEQEQVFHAPLEREEIEAINALVSKHKSNAALTQQLALDASKLVATSQDRLAKQTGAGFFKRLGSVISGKTGENQLLNQMDMLQMQRFSWHYLQQLQQQNLINSQSIAVIRNNLGTMNDCIIETREFLEQAIDKIDRRLRHVENNVSFNSWSHGIEANKRRYKSLPKTVLILRLTYEFMLHHQDVQLTEHDANYLITTLGKLGIDCDEEIDLLSFISELIDQIEVIGIDQYRQMITLAFDEHVVDSDFIQKNISGTGFNALYFLSDQYDKINDLISDEELCNSDEAREKLISKFFGNEFANLATVYSIRDLMCEMIGGGQLAIDVYKEVHGLHVIHEEIAEEQLPEAVTLVSTLPDIRRHTFFDSQASDESKRRYLLLFALCLENSAALNRPSLEFITLLSEKAGFPGMQEDILRLADHPRKQLEYVPVMQELLDDNDKQYTWLFDAFFLLALAQKSIENPQIKVVLGALKPVQLKEYLPNLLLILNGNEDSAILDAASKLAAHTDAWKNVIRYREQRFEQYFAGTLKQLNTASWESIQLLMELSGIYTKSMEHAFFCSFSDGSLMSNLADKAAFALCTQGRKSVLSSLNSFHKKAASHIAEYGSLLRQANHMISRWNHPAFEFANTMYRNDFDLDNSASNDDWGDQFQHYYQKIDDTLNAFSSTCSDAMRQIEFFTKGDFDQSVLKIREQKRADYLRQQQQEKLEKQSVTIIKEGREYLFSIEWENIRNPPCKLDDIKHIKTDGKIWVIVAMLDNDEVFYRSEDGLQWQEVKIDTPDITLYFDKISVVNGVWMIKNRCLRSGTREEGVYYSSDAITWSHTAAPQAAGNEKLSLGNGRLIYKDIIHFNGMWLWFVEKYQKYNYVEKGFFSDSTKTDDYSSAIVFCADSLAGPWRRWDQTPRLSEGVEVKAFCALPGQAALLAFCEYNSSYTRNKKRPETSPFVMYFGLRKEWQNCSWGGEANFYGDSPLIVKLNDKLVYFGRREIFTSDKGYEWSQQQVDMYAEEHFSLQDVSLFTSRNGSELRLSQDATSFKEITLDEGVWRHMVANEDGILAVYYPNQHEEIVLRVGRYLCTEKR
jgi:hypothetical protein